MFAKFQKIRPLRRYHYCILYIICTLIVYVYVIRTHYTRIQKDDSTRLFTYNIHSELIAGARILFFLATTCTLAAQSRRIPGFNFFFFDFGKLKQHQQFFLYIFPAGFKMFAIGYAEEKKKKKNAE